MDDFDDNLLDKQQKKGKQKRKSKKRKFEENSDTAIISKRPGRFLKVLLKTPPKQSDGKPEKQNVGKTKKGKIRNKIFDEAATIETPKEKKALVLSNKATVPTPTDMSENDIFKITHIEDVNEIRDLVIRVHQFASKTWPPVDDSCNCENVKRTSIICGVDRAIVKRCLKKPKKDKTKDVPIVPKKIEVTSDLDKIALKQVIHDFYLRGEVPFVKKISKVLSKNEQLAVYTDLAVRRCLKSLNFIHKAHNMSKYYVEKLSVLYKRITYWRSIKSFREVNAPVYYIDEMWINPGCMDLDNKTPEQKKQTKNKYLAILVGSNKGVFHVHCPAKVNAETFEEWFRSILRMFEPGSVIVMDKSPHHARLPEKIPTIFWATHDIIYWLRSKNIPYNEVDSKAQFLEYYVKPVREKYKKYAVQELAKQYNINVLYLPPQHFELNACRYAWIDIITYMNNKIKSGIAHYDSLLNEAVGSIEPFKWNYYCNQVVDLENKQYNVDHKIDEVMDALIEEKEKAKNFTKNKDDESSSDSSDSSDSDDNVKDHKVK